MTRGSYRRKNEMGAREDRDEIEFRDLSAFDSALDRFLAVRDRTKLKKPERKPFVRKRQVAIRATLFVMLAKSAVAHGLAVGIVHKPELSTEGWEKQLVDYDL